MYVWSVVASRWGKQEKEEKDEPIEVEKPNFGLTGALAKDQTTGNMQNGVIIKFSEPPEARQPTKRYRLYVFKDDKNIGGTAGVDCAWRRLFG